MTTEDFDEFEDLPEEELLTEVVECQQGARTPTDTGVEGAFSLYELWREIRSNKELQLLNKLAAKDFDFRPEPEDNTHPYFFGTDLDKVNPDDNYFVYGVLVEGYAWTPDMARQVRDFLFEELGWMVRMAYLLPSLDGVYIIADGQYTPGDSAAMRKDYLLTAMSILTYSIHTLMLYKNHTWYFHVRPCQWCYLSGDDSARFMPRQLWDFDTTASMYNCLTNEVKKMNKEIVKTLKEKEQDYGYEQ